MAAFLWRVQTLSGPVSIAFERTFKMSAGVMLKSLRKVSRYPLAVLRAPLVASYHTERGVFGYRPRRGNSEEPDAVLQELLNTHSSLNQGQCGL